MKNLTLENLTKVCGGVYSGPSDKLEQEVSSITTDSRKAEAGTLFVPIVGERVDAHKFIPQVMEAGALATLSVMSAKEPMPPPRQRPRSGHRHRRAECRGAYA